MLTGGGTAVGSWLALWLTPSKHITSMIWIGICGAISVVAFICWVYIGSFKALILVSEWPILGFIVVSIVAYSVFFAAIEPIWIGINRRLRSSWHDVEETMKTVAEEVDKYEKKKERDTLDRYFDEWGSRQNKKRKEPRVGDRNLSEELMERGDAYVSKAQVMTPSEQLAYRVIEEKYRDRFFVFAQMRVVDVIQPNTALHPKNSKEYNALFRQLSQWHFDFVLCYREDFRVCCAIELDDPSHQQKARQKRDRILNQACEAAGVRLERMMLNYDRKLVERVNEK